MFRSCPHLSLLVVLLLLGACTSIPTTPEVLALPGTGKSLEQFRNDDVECRQYAVEQVGGSKTPSQSAKQSEVRSAVAGTAVGGFTVNDATDSSSEGLRRRYDFAFVQCMYAKGHRIPVLGRPVRY